MSLNKCTFIGRLGKDPEVRTVASGKVATFPLAMSEKYKDAKGDRQEKTTWANIVAWKGSAEIAEKYLKKGNEVCVITKMRTRQYDKAGVQTWITEFIVEEIILIGSKNNGANGGQQPVAATVGSNGNAVDDLGGNSTDDLPF